jgi:hypothetical protein
MNCTELKHRQFIPVQAAGSPADTQSMDNKKAVEQIETLDGPQTFEEALQFALQALTGTATGIPDEWLAALDREKGREQGS